MACRTKLLNRKYAPFGYVLEGLDLIKVLQAGDMIVAPTYVNESGMMNLKKIRGTTFANAMNSEEND